MKKVWLLENEQARWFEFEEPHDMPNDVTVTMLTETEQPAQQEQGDSIIDEDQKATLRKYNRMKKVNRVEVIDDSGRAYVKYLKEGEGIAYVLQDDEQTLKVFIDDFRWKGE